MLASVSKDSKPRKKPVEVRPSRIRRDPVPGEKPASLDKAMWQSREWEIGLAIVGIILFALAINAISIGFSAITG